MRNTLFILLVISLACSDDDQSPSLPSTSFDPPVSVNVSGYTDHLMEPFLSRDGQVMFFNNLNSPEVNTNLHWATRVDDLTFQYQGELTDANTQSLEGVPTMDENGTLYYVSTQSYSETLSSLYTGKFSAGAITNISIVPNVSRNEAGWVNFDVEISADGNNMYYVDGQFDENGGPYQANFVLAIRNNRAFSRIATSDNIFQNINTDNLEYAAAITKDQLEICFTRVSAPLAPDVEPRLYIAQRVSPNSAFEQPVLLESLTGFVEGATYDSKDEGIYFHRKDQDGLHRLYYARRSSE